MPCVSPTNLTMLATVLAEHCKNCGYQKDCLERAESASFLMLLFSNGVQSADRLKTALEVRKRALDNWCNYHRSAHQAEIVVGTGGQAVLAN
jgi:hypothetical protein